MSCTNPPCLKLCRFGCGGFDQGDDNGRFNSLLLRLLRTGQPERRHWINTVPGPGKEGDTKKWGGEREGIYLNKIATLILKHVSA